MNETPPITNDDLCAEDIARDCAFYFDYGGYRRPGADLLRLDEKAEATRAIERVGKLESL